MGNKEQTLVLVKPDAMIKGLAGEVLSTLIRSSINVVALKLVRVSEELAKIHYDEHKERDFFEKLIEHLTGKYHVDQVLAIVCEGENVVSKVRSVAGATHPEDADPQSLRGKFGRVHTKTEVFENVIHASATPQEGEREVKLWFEPSELLSVIYSTTTKEITKEERVWSN